VGELGPIVALAKIESHKVFMPEVMDPYLSIMLLNVLEPTSR
jgi:hypothetical protein